MSVQKLRQIDLLSAKDAAAMLDVSPDTVRRWTRNGKVPHVRLPSGRVRYRKIDILALLAPVASEESESLEQEEAEPDASLDVPLPGLMGV